MFNEFGIKRNIRNLEPIYSQQKSFYGKAKVWRDSENYLYLDSYGTTVAMIDNVRNVFRLWGGYSRTTLIHVNEFVQQFSNPDMKITASAWRNMEVF